MSRRDYNQTELKAIPISTMYKSDGKMNQAFTTYFETNGTHVKCCSNEEWAQQWFELELFQDNPCNTSNVPVALIYWR